ncbi:MAG TPA: FAD-dependent oxidoreductase, partial [Nitrospiria bacterium]
RMRKLRAQISHLDSAERFKAMGVDVFIGDGRFTGSGTAAVDGKTLRFSRAVICTGARAALPPIPGLDGSGCLTNETVFSLTALPPRLAVIGAGPIGCELAQAFARFGSRVTVLELAPRILPREDAEAAGIVGEALARDGVRLLLGAGVGRVEIRGREKIIHHTVNGAAGEVAADEILVGVGRAPNVEGMGLEEAGVEYSRKTGIKVNRHLQTTRPAIYAAGDVCFPQQFTHAADALAQIVIQNALFPHPFGLGRADTAALLIPRCTYTDPEIAQVGLTADEAAARGLQTEAFSFQMNEVDRAILDGEDRGYAQVRILKGTDRIVGATIVASHAGEMISELTLAMRAGAGLGKIGGTIHPYPTQSEVIRKTANAWRKTRFTQGQKKFLTRWFSWTR